MNVPYLKKTKMYKLLNELVDEELEIMSQSTYKFYRGSEWLSCATKSIDYDKVYSLYHSGYFISLDILKYNKNKDKYEDIDRITYRLKDNELVEEYHRLAVYEDI